MHAQAYYDHNLYVKRYAEPYESVILKSFNGASMIQLSSKIWYQPCVYKNVYESYQSLLDGLGFKEFLGQHVFCGDSIPSSFLYSHYDILSIDLGSLDVFYIGDMIVVHIYYPVDIA